MSCVCQSKDGQSAHNKELNTTSQGQGSSLYAVSVIPSTEHCLAERSIRLCTTD